jgi:hypothetical protein
VICPVHLEGECFGLFEFAFLKTIKPREKNLINKCTETLAYIFNRSRINEKTNKLLEKSKQQSEELTKNKNQLERRFQPASAKSGV